MHITSNLLYLLLLYAVLDKNNRLSVTTGLLIAGGIMLFSLCMCNPLVFNNCYRSRECCGGRNQPMNSNPFILTNNLF